MQVHFFILTFVIAFFSKYESFLEGKYGEHMMAWRFRQIKSLIPRIMESEELRLDNDDWWQFKDRVAKFDQKRKEKVYASYALVFDETMSAYVPR